jgi:hypothetical protein
MKWWGKHARPKRVKTKIVVGPFCYIVGSAHAEPFSKTTRGKERRDARRAKHEERMQWTNA